MSKELPKLYSMTSISIASALGSILAGGYMLYSNYRALGMNQYSGYIFALCVVTVSYTHLTLPTILRV